MRATPLNTAYHAMAYMKAKGSAQGVFAEDKSRAGKDRTLCLSVGFRGEVPHDVRGGKHATTRHQPVTIVHLWSPATAQFLTAMWANETLDEVEIAFVRPDGTGKEEEYATMKLGKATVAHVDLRSGETVKLAEGHHGAVFEVGLHFEKIEFKLKGEGGPLVASYDRTKHS
jgi:type VI secretion system Hcp family effector